MQAEKKERYLRQIAVSELGEKGQEALKNTTFLVIGAGGLGCPATQCLAASGAGKLILADCDTVEANNLSRQFLHTTQRLGMNKAESAKIALSTLNPYLEIETFTDRITDENLPGLVARADVVLDCCDNSATRHVVNRACHVAKKPLVTAGAIRGAGQLSVFDFRTEPSPCYACAFPEDEEKDLKASSLGVLTILTCLMGTLEASEAVKIAAGLGSDLAGKVLLIDLLHDDFQVMKLAADPACRVCGG